MTQDVGLGKKDTSRRAAGARAEALAAEHLEKLGYRIIQRNFRCAEGEVDLIAWDGAVLCFIEVRSRATDDFGDPLETIGPQKIRRVVMAARAYLQNFQGIWPEMRFDAVGILMLEPPKLTLVRDAFEA